MDGLILILGYVSHLALITPKQCKSDIPLTLAGLISTIVDISKVRKKRLNELQKVFYFHKFSQNVIQETVWKATVVPIENLRASKAKTNINNFACAKHSNGKEHHSKKCSKPRCAYCDYIKEGIFRTCKTTGIYFTLNRKYDVRG